MSKVRHKLRVGSRTYKILKLLHRLGSPVTIKDFFLATPHRELHVNREGLKRMNTKGLIVTQRDIIWLTPYGQFILDEMIDPRNIVVKQLTSYVWIGIRH
jgi:hypothetical protein